MTHKNTNIEKEARILTKYLINKESTSIDIQLFKDADKIYSIYLNPREAKIYAACLKSRWILSMVDAGLSFINLNPPLHAGSPQRLLSVVFQKYLLQLPQFFLANPSSFNTEVA